MPTILLITVGGSPQPIITAIQSLNPDRTVFICSDGARGSVSQVIGEGMPCEIRRGTEVVERLPNLPTYLGMGDRFHPDTDLVRLDNPDDLAECYGRIAAKINEIKTTDPNTQLLADYTGGTKTMSLALGMAALDYGVALYLTTNATRENLIRVERGESTERAPTTLLTVERTLNQDLPRFLQDYNYSGFTGAGCLSKSRGSTSVFAGLQLQRGDRHPANLAAIPGTASGPETQTPRGVGYLQRLRCLGSV